MSYTEDSLVEQPAIQLFAELGWETLSASDEVMGASAVPLGAFVGGWSMRWRGPASVAASGLALAGIALVAMSGWALG